MHYHVKSNTANTLRDDDVHCVDAPEHATLALVQDLANLSLSLLDGCDQDGCGYCGWCRSAREARSLTGVAAWTRIDADLQGASALVVTNPATGPEGAFALWMETVPGQRAVCTDYLRR